MNPLNEFLNQAGYTTFAGGGQGDIRIFLAGMVQAALSVVGVIFLILVLYAGFLWLTAGGNTESVSRARTLLLSAIVGFIITLGAFMITRFAVGLIESASRERAGGTPQGASIFD